MQQQSLGMGYQDWQNQQDQERANIGWQQAAMSGLPYKGQVTSSRYTPQTGSTASFMGTGIAAMGAMDQYNKNQQGPAPASSSSSWQAPSWNPTGSSGNQNTSNSLWQGNFPK
jgi:hypothetical protein